MQLPDPTFWVDLNAASPNANISNQRSGMMGCLFTRVQRLLRREHERRRPPYLIKLSTEQVLNRKLFEYASQRASFLFESDLICIVAKSLGLITLISQRRASKERNFKALDFYNTSRDRYVYFVIFQCIYSN